jgi:hypothetical protein
MIVSPYSMISKRLLTGSIITSYIIYCIHYGDVSLSMRHPANAISSFAYAAYQTDKGVQLPLFVLSVASFNLWSQDNSYINFVDVTSIFWTIVVVTLNTIKDNRLVIYAVDGFFILYIAVVFGTGAQERVVAYYSENLIPLNAIIYLLCAVVGASLHRGSKHYLIGSLCITTGFACKLLTILANQYWGTCLFHLLSAAGIGRMLQINMHDSSDVKYLSFDSLV